MHEPSLHDSTMRGDKEPINHIDRESQRQRRRIRGNERYADSSRA